MRSGTKADGTDIPDSSIHSVLSKLIEEGKVKQIKSDQSSDPDQYQVITNIWD